MAIHITVYRQFIGANVLVTFSSQIVSIFFPGNSIAAFTGLIVNCIQLLSNAVALFSFTRYFGRRPMFLFGSISVTIVNWALALALFFEVKYLVITLMCVYMLFFGSTFFPVSWSVPSEIIPPEEAVYANVPGWIATSIVVSCPPIISGAMDGSVYPVFFFFGAYGIFGTFGLYKWLVETKGKTYEQIIK
jgi:MFS family permease